MFAWYNGMIDGGATISLSASWDEPQWVIWGTASVLQQPGWLCWVCTL